LTADTEQGRNMISSQPDTAHFKTSRIDKPGRWSLSACGFAAVSLLLLAAAPARADFCVQLDGGVFGGDLGFFRFKGTRPTADGSVMTLKGRVAGLSPVFGTAVVAKDGSYLEIGATFFADNEQGQIDLTFFPPTGSSGSGDGDYGQYGTGQSFNAKIVRCRKEP
jgi:hypothetical protein